MKISQYEFPKPTKCIIWKKPEVVRGNGGNIFETLDTYTDDEHLFRRLLKCRECGQQYFYEMYEEIDWVDGDDPQYRKYIPVSTMSEVEMLREASTPELLQASPALRSDFPKGATAPHIYWVGKNE